MHADRPLRAKVEARFVAAVVKDDTGDRWRENRSLPPDAFDDDICRRAWKLIAAAADHESAAIAGAKFFAHETMGTEYIEDRDAIWINLLRSRGLAYAPEWFQAISGIGRRGSIADALAGCLFDPAAELAEPRIIYRLQNRPICTEGNIATITAQAKAGKSAYVGAFISAALAGDDDVDALGLTGRNIAGTALLHFDTEQSPHDHAALLRRALSRAARESWPAWFRSYQFSGKLPGEARALMDHAIETAAKEFGGIHAVLIDGVGDLVLDVNDPKESFPFVTHLHAQALRYRTAIVGVLHLNPGTQTGKTRGHLGSHLERKAETNLLLEKDGQASIVWSEKQRGAPIAKAEGPRFCWDDMAGMHRSIEARSSAKDAEKLSDLRDLAEEVFGEVTLRYADACKKIETARRVGEKASEKWFTTMKKAGVITKVELGFWRLSPA